MSTENIQMSISEANQKTPTPEDGDESSPPQLTLQTLVNVKQLVEVAVKRGAYNPSELSMVGNIYDNFSRSIAYMVEQSNQNSTENSTENSTSN